MRLFAYFSVFLIVFLCMFLAGVVFVSLVYGQRSYRLQTVLHDSVGREFCFLIEDSVVNVDLSVEDVSGSPYSINITFIYLASGERWSWSDVSYASKPLTPKFIVPKTGIYEYIIEVKDEGGAPLLYTATLTVDEVGNYYFVFLRHVLDYLLVLSTIALVFAFLNAISRHVNVKSSFVRVVCWELGGLWRFYLAILILGVFVFACVYAGSYIRPLILPLILHFKEWVPMVVDGVSHSIIAPPEEYWIIYYIYVAVVFASLFNYETESGLYKGYLLFGLGKFKLFMAKFLTGFLLSISPLIMVRTVLSSMYYCEFLFSNLNVWMHVLLRSLMVDLMYCIAMLSLILLAILLPLRAPYTVLAAILLPYMLQNIPMFSRESSLQMLFTIIFNMSYMPNVLSHFLPYIPIFILAFALMVFRFVLRDYP